MATAPQVDYCLVCEDLRLEPGNKATILGYYGMLPRVKILLGEWGKTIEKLIFLISTHGADAPYEAQIKLINPDGSDLIAAGSITADPGDTASDNSAIGVGFRLITFAQQGQHQVQIFINSAKAYESTFIVGLQNPSKIMHAGRNEACPCGSGKKFKQCHGVG
jgi:SEC-C motif-containing protein